MKNLTEKLQELSSNFPLEKNFIWDVPSTAPIDIPEDIKNSYLRNIYLKENMSEILQNDLELKNHYWIIQEWGGIKSLKQNQRNDEKIRKFKKQINTEKLTKETFGLISSFSKIASFLEPKKYAIYDSRVIYSLNWLIFRYCKDNEFFPQPTGRSAALAKYDMQTIFRLSNRNYTYISHKDAFFKYCHLLSELSEAVYNDKNPYKIEMLLFLIAPEYIVSDIDNSVEISIN